jgi:hypothetical protein
MLVPALVLAISAPAAAQDQVPAALRSLKPAQIVEVVAAERTALDLTTVQARQLDSLNLAIIKEPHSYKTAPSAPGKAHRNTRMEPMISQQEAYADALAILTTDQRARAKALFGDPGYQLPAQFQARAVETTDSATDPLQHHGAGAAPAAQSTKTADSTTDPLQHHGGELPSMAADDSGKPTDPVTHKQ